uniref:TUG ubiquitin-like domain-containing protein n=1 Tax=Aureoumbra lagunensis TaxID=44058 RepID=A0A7S3JMX0_9STRA|mmetsp:Transcript_9675/g.13431  ORF Transcript_9675/g.13431 Transcript_9675/m.13431 type:complete len:573 (-) Transcript_9675:165-1883(-)
MSGTVLVIWQGHREEIKIEASRQPLRITILEEALRRFNIKTGKCYGLRRSRARKAEANVDLSIDWMHSGLMNKCELDLITVTPRQGQVRIGVSCDDGTTFTANADCTRSMRATYIIWINEGKVPKRQLMRCSVLRQDLDLDTPLSGLGYGPGANFRADLFLGSEIVDDIDMAKNNASFPPPNNDSDFPISTECLSTKMDVEETSKQTCIKDLDDAISRITPEATKIISKYVSAALKQPNVPPISLENKVFKSQIASSEDGLKIMRLAGWSTHAGFFLIASPRPDWLGFILERLQAQLHSQVNTNNNPPQNFVDGFNPYQSTRLNLGAKGTAPPPVTSTETAPEKELRLLRAKRAEALARAPPVIPELRLVDRRLMISKATPDDQESNRRADAAALRAAIVSRARNTDTPLITAAARELATLRNTPLFHAIRLKIMIDDHMALALSFSTMRTVADLITWLEIECFESDDHINFDLYQIYPKSKLDSSHSLSEFAPAAVLKVYPIPVLKSCLSLLPQPQDDPGLYPKPLGQKGISKSSAATSSTNQARTVSQGGLPDRRDPPSKKPFSWLKTGN